MRRRTWALRVGVAVLALLICGWVVSIARPTLLRVYGLGARGADGAYNLGIELGPYDSGFGVNIDRLGHTSGRWVSLESLNEARHFPGVREWRWWPRIVRRGGPYGWTMEVFVPFWPLVVGVGGFVVWVYRWPRLGPGRCPRCGYDLRGLAACPECGPAR